MPETVVVTGLGVVSSIGIGIETFWSNALDGRSGVRRLSPLEGFEADEYKSQVAGQIVDFDPDEELVGSEGSRLDPYARYSLVATREAMLDSGLEISQVADPHRIGVIVGAAMGGMVMGEREIYKLYKTRRAGRVHPSSIPAITLNSASGIVSIMTGAKGPNLTISTACSSSAHAIGHAMTQIRSGNCDAVITVGADASMTPLVFGGFNSLRALSSSFNATPERASRPFDRARDGFVMGEGAAALILESASHAKARGARVYAEVAGYAATSEAHDMVIPQQDGEEVATTIRYALRDARMSADDIDYISAHATSTPVGDAVEARAIRKVFGRRADEVRVSAIKSLLGHTLGAAAAMAGVATVLSLESGKIHPTLNYDDPDPECRLDGISSKAQQAPLRAALLNAFGFGSNNAAVIFRRPG